MLFNSTTFWLFFAAVFTLYLPSGPRARNWILLIASYVFYGSWDWRFLGLLALSTLVDYTCGLQIERSPEHGRRWVFFSVAVNLGVLGIFKYFDFFADSFSHLAAVVGFELSPATLHVVLPVGISFYTFQTLGYTIDIYRREGRATHRLRDFALYVAFFPQLVAGPIERSTHLLPQLEGEKRLDLEGFRAGAYLVLFGMFKKVVVADNMARIVENSFDGASPAGGMATCLGVYAFALQIYGDFSGYTDIARGVAKFLGVDLTLNFRRPYFATNPRDFWSRWHISLSRWLRDYLYIPLGGNRGGTTRTFRNLFLTMLLGGLWHGAGWMFVLWGGLHGLYLVAHRLLLHVGRGLRGRFVLPSAGRRVLKVVAGFAWFHAVCVAWVFFRAGSMTRALEILSAPFGPLEITRGDLRTLAFMMVCAGPLLLMDLWAEIHQRRNPEMGELSFVRTLPIFPRSLVFATLLALLAIAAAPQGAEFIYFQF